MDNIICLTRYRQVRSVTLPELAHKGFWACGACGDHTWTFSAAAEIRCSACGMRAGNLAVVEIGSGGMHQ